MKKISFVITCLVRSGAETVTVRLAKRYFELGYDVEIIMLLYPDIEFELPEGIKVIDYSGNTSSRIKRIPYWIKHLKSHLKERKPDIVVSFIARINVITMMCVDHKKTKVILSERNDPRHDSRNFITKLLINHYYPKATHIVFQTNEVMKLFNKRIQEKGIVIANPINIEKFASVDNFDSNLVLYAGRYSEQKDVYTIINSSKYVHEALPTVRFELYGDGPLKEELKKYVIDNNLGDYVFINNNIPNIREKMLDSSLFVMSSLYEGMSNSLLEAIYSGVPSLSTPVLGSSVVQDRINGYIYNFKDYEQLANIIIRTLSNKQEYIALRKRTIEMAKTINHNDVFRKWDDIIN